MVKKMNLSFLFKPTESKSTWPWPSCRQPRTLSFRTTANDILTTAATDTTDSFFTISSDSGSFSTASDSSAGDPVERMIRGLRSERLLFEPAGKTSSILEEAAAAETAEGEEILMRTTAVTVESEDPYVDFRRSMEEMVEGHRLRDWKSLEELLSWYLRVNRKGNHGFILGAFVDLLVSLAMASSSSSSSSSSSLLSLCSSAEIEEISSLEDDEQV